MEVRSFLRHSLESKLHTWNHKKIRGFPFLFVCLFLSDKTWMFTRNSVRSCEFCLYVSVFRSVCWSVGLPGCLPVCLSVCLSVGLSSCLLVCGPFSHRYIFPSKRSSSRYLLLVYTKTADSVKRARWLARQTPNILSYLPPSNMGKNGVPVCIRSTMTELL